MDSGLSSRINLVILDGANDFRSTFNTGSDEIRKQVRLVALFGRDRRVGECLLLREERKSGLRGPISVFDPGCVKTRLRIPKLLSTNSD